MSFNNKSAEGTYEVPNSPLKSNQSSFNERPKKNDGIGSFSKKTFMFL